MRILFLLRLWPVYGGGETVTRLLANEFVQRGIEVHVAFFKYSTCDTYPFLDERIITHHIKDVDCDENTCDDVEDYYGVNDVLCALINEYQIDFVVNIWHPLSYVKKLKSITTAKIIWCLHSIFVPPYEKPKSLIRWIKHSMFRQHYLKNHYNAAVEKVNKVLPYVDKYVFLSRRYEEEYESICKEESKITSISNPIPIKERITARQFEEKENVVLVVGRMIEHIKRFSIALKVWRCVEHDKELERWKLIFVGDGESLVEYQEMARVFGLKRVEFVGYKPPVPFYQSAKVILMTSKIEGFPMVILEAQQMGVVPVVMDSFPAIHDMVVDEVNGVIVSNNNLSEMYRQLRKLMLNQDRLLEMARNGVEIMKDFSVDSIVAKWERLFQDMMNDDGKH